MPDQKVVPEKNVVNARAFPTPLTFCGSTKVFFSSVYCIIFLILIAAAVGAIVRGKVLARKAAAKKED